MEKGDFFSDCFFKWFSGKLSEECGYLLFKSDPGVPGRSGEEPLQAWGLLKEAEFPCALCCVVYHRCVVCPFLIGGHVSLLLLLWWLKWIPGVSQQLNHQNQTLQFDFTYEAPVVVSPLDKAHLPPAEQRELRYLGEASTVLGIVR